MKIIISPAKKMVVDTDTLPWETLPQFLESTQQLGEILQSMTAEALQKLWQCNDKILAENLERLSRMDLKQNLTPAILSYEGIQYRYLAPGVLEEQALAYLSEHLRILSGFYGILRPFDVVVPYRLEMQAKLKLYDFWGERLSDTLSQADWVCNLASKEYAKAVVPYLEKSKVITCRFVEPKGDKLVEKATMCKMARGQMVRFMAERQVKTPQELTRFDQLGYEFSEEHSTAQTYIFIKGEHDIC